MQEAATNLWQTPGVAGVGIWESNSKFHLFTKRRLADWEKQAFAKLLAECLVKYVENPDQKTFKVLGNYIHLYIESPFPPLAILTQVETFQLPNLANLVLGIQQDCQQAIALFELLANRETSKFNRKLSLSKYFTEDVPKTEESNISIEELINAFNQLIDYCAKYIGKTIALKYLEKNRPQGVCLDNFQLDKSLNLKFSGNIKERVTPNLKEAVKLWLIDFIKEASSVFTYLPQTVQQNALDERQKAILFA